MHKLKGELTVANKSLKTVKDEMEQCQLKVHDMQRENEKLIKNIQAIYEDMECLKRDNDDM